MQAVSKHLQVLEDAGLVSRTREAQRRPVHLEAEVFDLMTKWIERYRRQAEERYRRLDDVLRAMPDDVDPTAPQTGDQAMTTTTHHDTEIIVDPDVPLVRIIREFDAPPEKVFRAHTDPELVVQWLGPRDLEMQRRPRSTAAPAARTATCTAATARSTASTAASTRCARPSSSCRPSPSRACPTASRSRSSMLEDLGGGRTRLIATSLVDSFEDRDAFVASGMETGILEGYERLDDLLAPRSRPRWRGRRGRSDSIESSASVMSSAVPKVARVLNSESSWPSGASKTHRHEQQRGGVGDDGRTRGSRRGRSAPRRRAPAAPASGDTASWRCSRMSRCSLSSARFLVRGASPSGCTPRRTTLTGGSSSCGRDAGGEERRARRCWR